MLNMNIFIRIHTCSISHLDITQNRQKRTLQDLKLSELMDVLNLTRVFN